MPRQLLLQIKADGPNKFEGMVLRRGVTKTCRALRISQAAFTRRARIGNNTLFKAYRGETPLRVYAYLWLFIAALRAGQADVPLFDPRADEA